ncbi:MAG: phage tail protein I [Planctomycetota bacterium]|nr:phage tail protein I [Planctomycetota bacterium]
MAVTLEQKRRLVKDAVKMHYHKGTRWSLERVFELLDMRGLVTEWWEAPDDPDFKPYEFDMDMEIARSISEGFYRQLLDLIDALKNIRSHLRRAKVFMTARSKVPAVASVLLGGVVVPLRPFHLGDVAMRAAVPKGAAIYQTFHEMEIRPFGGTA